jgi:glycosyltransferase involved in cell wall biosynthesis
MWGDENSSSNTYKSLKGGWLLGSGKFRIPFANRALIESIRTSDVVMTGGWHTPAFLRTLKNAKKYGKCSLLWFESTLESARFRSGPIALIRKRIFLLSDAVFVPGPSAALAAQEYSNGQIPVVQLSNPIQPMFLDAGTETFGEKISSGTRFLYFGRLLQLKRIDLLIDAFSMIASPEDTLTIVGDGPMKDALVSQASRTIRSGQIFFEHAVRDEDAIGVYRQHQVLVLPSNREVWGMVIAEALVLGLRVVASDAAGASATFAEFPTVNLFRSESISDLSEKLTKAKQNVMLNQTQRDTLIALNSPKEFVLQMTQEVLKIQHIKNLNLSRNME